MAKSKEAVVMNNCPDKSAGRKRLVHTFTKTEFLKFILCILSAVTYEIKEQRIQGKTETYVSKKVRSTIQRDFMVTHIY